MSSELLPEITLQSPEHVLSLPLPLPLCPMVVWGALRAMPTWLGTAAEASGLVPMRLPATRSPPPPVSARPVAQPLMTRPRTVELPPEMDSPVADASDAPERTTQPPGSVVPSMVTGVLTAGSALEGLMVGTPPPGMSKVIDWSPPRWSAS